ncbi:MAG: trehalose-phosphatase [Caulobacterales bacterium]|jgi:trehalose 6-phosphate phosphatase|nr:trehalose-phosphatase [Caulobacterales bacterium]
MRGQTSIASVFTPLMEPPALDPRAHALFLDFDGTLADIAPRPEDVVLAPALRQTLATLTHAMGGAVALLSGRSTSNLRGYLGGAVMHVAGIHGQELESRGLTQPSPASVAAAAAEFRALQHEGALTARIEDKTLSLALHYRHDPSAEAEVRRIAHSVAARRQLRVLEGKMVVELIAGSFDKGDALDAFMRAPAFLGRTPIMVGDDTTDEDAFTAAHRLGGFGVLVGPPRPSSASFLLASPSAVHAWLSTGLGA